MSTATAHELTTPTGVLVYDGPPRSDEWFATRRAGITATDIPAIIGESSHGNARSVWAEKRGELPSDEAGEAGWWGTALEPLVADRWAEVHGVTVRPVGVLANAAAPWQRASLDRLVDDCPDGDGPCGLECKTRSAFTAGLWRDDLPSDVHAQVMWQMVVTGHRHEHVACLLGGQRLVSMRVDWDQEIADWLVTEAERVWRHVLAGTPPEVRFDDVHLSKVLARLFPDRSGDAVIPVETGDLLLAEWADAKAELTTARAIARDAEARVKACETWMVDLLGSAETARIEGTDEPAWTYATKNRRGYTVQPCTYRQLTVGGTR